MACQKLVFARSRKDKEEKKDGKASRRRRGRKRRRRRRRGRKARKARASGEAGKETGWGHGVCDWKGMAVVARMLLIVGVSFVGGDTAA